MPWDGENLSHPPLSATTHSTLAPRLTCWARNATEQPYRLFFMAWLKAFWDASNLFKSRMRLTAAAETQLRARSVWGCDAAGGTSRQSRMWLPTFGLAMNEAVRSDPANHRRPSARKRLTRLAPVFGVTLNWRAAAAVLGCPQPRSAPSPLSFRRQRRILGDVHLVSPWNNEASQTKASAIQHQWATS